MFNLLVGLTDGTVEWRRVLEHTPDHVSAYIKPGGVVEPSRLLALPTLLMPETGDMASPQFARVGRIDSLNLVGANYRFRFTPTPGIPEIPSDEIVAAAGDLGITDWEFHRTHWAVKDHDLYGALIERLLPSPMAPRVFALPTSPREDDLVSVMMPFDASFKPVYTALSDAVEAAGLRCLRADDIWEHDHVMDDIVSLIWRSRIVISDLSGRNPNVFYETGIAHTLGRDVIMVTQSRGDVPFDLRPLRYIPYLPNGEGLEGLKAELTSRIRSIIGS